MRICRLPAEFVIETLTLCTSILRRRRQEARIEEGAARLIRSAEAWNQSCNLVHEVHKSSGLEEPAGCNHLEEMVWVFTRLQTLGTRDMCLIDWRMLWVSVGCLRDFPWMGTSKDFARHSFPPGSEVISKAFPRKVTGPPQQLQRLLSDSCNFQHDFVPETGGMTTAPRPPGQTKSSARISNTAFLSTFSQSLYLRQVGTPKSEGACLFKQCVW